jgi:hypothetical protein
MLVCALSTFLHTRPRVQRAPGIPCALSIPGRMIFSKPRAHRAARMRRHIQLSSPGLTGRPSISETPMIKSKSHRILDTRFRRHDSVGCGGTTTSWREAMRRSNPVSPPVWKDGLLPPSLVELRRTRRCARNDDSLTRNSSQRIAPAQIAPASEWRLRLISALDVNGWAAKPPT